MGQLSEKSTSTSINYFSLGLRINKPIDIPSGQNEGSVRRLIIVQRTLPNEGYYQIVGHNCLF